MPGEAVKKYRKALDNPAIFSKEELIQLTMDLIEINSENQPGSNEEAVAIFLHKKLLQEGITSKLDYVTDGRPNVIAVLKGNKPGKTLLLNGHSDVVPAGDEWDFHPFQPYAKEGKIFGRGSSDMKSGVASIVYSMMVLKRLGCSFSGEILLLINVDEERINLGMKHFLEQGHNIDEAIIAEPTNNNICVAHKGIARYRICTTGRSEHAAQAEGADNAILKMIPVLQELQSIASKVANRYDSLLGNASLSITQIDGGQAPNMIPEKCQIELDWRLLPQDTKQSLDEELNILSEKLDAGIERYLFIPASKINPDHEFVVSAVNSMREIKNSETRIGIFNATCEAPFLAVDKGIPTLIIGPGSLEQAHMANEYCYEHEIIEAAQFFINFVMTR